ncbi:MAG: formylglycine-generating enzyme family protein [Elusimicrobiota bacterium]
MKREWILSAAFMAASLCGPLGSAAAAGPASGGNGAAIQWTPIPGGEFTMGADDLGASAQAPHHVKVPAFQMAKTLTTFGQYKKCVAAGACVPAHVSDGTCNVYDGSAWVLGKLPAKFQADDQPLVCVDWDEARRFAAWAGGRLPTEAEWEYAARGAGDDRKFPWGDDAATCDRAIIAQGGLGCGKSATWPVCSKTKGNTAQGLCDMAGNVWEWTQDWYHETYKDAPADASAWESPAGTRRVLRGGSWIRYGKLVRSALRMNDVPSARFDNIGFRPVRIPAAAGR